MDINTASQVSTFLSSQSTANELQVSLLKLGKEQMEAEGQAALQLIQSVPQATGNVGNNINIAV